MRLVARLGVPIGILAGLLALTGAVLLIVNLASGAGAWTVLASVATVAFWGPIGWGVGIELRRSVRAWDAALSE